MPNRILKESITTSRTIDQLSLEEERLFYRLLVVCDDYGRFEGEPSIILGRCFPRKIGHIAAKDIGKWLMRLVEVGLVRHYTVDGSSYIQFITWERHQQKRARNSKYPEPPAVDTTFQPLQSVDSNCEQPITNVPVFVFEKRETRNEKRPDSSGADAPVSIDVRRVFEAYLTIQPTARFLDAVRAKIKTRLKTYTVDELCQAVEKFKDNYWWLTHNGKRGAAWFFESDTRIEQFLNLEPDAGARASPNGQAATTQYHKTARVI